VQHVVITYEMKNLYGIFYSVPNSPLVQNKNKSLKCPK
jgi:hypothetical protein